MLEGGKPANKEVVTHIDRCLSCLSCMTTCPSGVNYMHLVDHARAHIEETYERPLADRLLRSVLARVLPYRGRFRAALLLARLARPLAPLVRVPSRASGDGSARCSLWRRRRAAGAPTSAAETGGRTREARDPARRLRAAGARARHQ